MYRSLGPSRHLDFLDASEADRQEAEVLARLDAQEAAEFKPIPRPVETRPMRSIDVDGRSARRRAAEEAEPDYYSEQEGRWFR